MKGISAVVATVLLLVITIALAGTAYLYFNGVFTRQIITSASTSPLDYCSDLAKALDAFSGRKEEFSENCNICFSDCIKINQTKFCTQNRCVLYLKIGGE